MKTAKEIINGLSLNMNDVARLAAEAAEELGERSQGLGRVEMLCLLRRVVRAGVEAVRAAEHTVSFEEAAWASVAARAGRRVTTLRDLRHFVRRMLRVEGIAQRPLRAMSTKECRELPEHRDMQLSLHLMLYSGVRPAEVCRLSIRHIRLNEGRVIIPAHSSKTGGGRVIPLRRKKKLQGIPLSIPRNWQKRWRALRRAAGFTHWQADVCRHTFASYHAAYFRDLPELQLEMGHRSTDLLRTRYLNLPKIANAKAYWQAG